MNKFRSKNVECHRLTKVMTSVGCETLANNIYSAIVDDSEYQYTSTLTLKTVINIIKKVTKRDNVYLYGIGGNNPTRESWLGVKSLKRDCTDYIFYINFEGISISMEDDNKNE